MHIELCVQKSFGIVYTKVYDINYKEIIPLKFKKIVLYGAGKRGRKFYDVISELNTSSIVAWIDKGKAGQQICGYQLINPEDVKKIEFDAILITVKDPIVVNEIIEDLSQMVSRDRIIWIDLYTKEIWNRHISFD